MTWDPFTNYSVLIAADFASSWEVLLCEVAWRHLMLYGWNEWDDLFNNCVILALLVAVKYNRSSVYCLIMTQS